MHFTLDGAHFLFTFGQTKYKIDSSEKKWKEKPDDAGMAMEYYTATGTDNDRSDIKIVVPLRNSWRVQQFNIFEHCQPNVSALFVLKARPVTGMGSNNTSRKRWLVITFDYRLLDVSRQKSMHFLSHEHAICATFFRAFAPPNGVPVDLCNVMHMWEQ